MDMVIPLLNFSQNEDDDSMEGSINKMVTSIGTMTSLTRDILKEIRGTTQKGKNLTETDPVDAKEKKENKKLNKKWFKWFSTEDKAEKHEKKAKTEYLKRFWKTMKGIGKQLWGIMKAVSSNLLMDILKLVLFLAIFDPKGKFLNSLITMAINVFSSIAKFITPWIPKIIMRMIHIITDVLPKALIRIIDGLFKVVSNMFADLAKNASSPTIKWILESLSSLFSPSGILASFLKTLAKLLPVFVGLMIAVKVIGIIGAVISGIGTVLGAILSVISFIGLLPIMIVGAIVLVGVLIYKYWDKIKAAIGGIWEWLGEVKDSIWDSLKGWGKSIYKGLVKIGKGYIKVITAPFRVIWKYLKPILSKMGGFFSKIGSVLSSVMKLIKDKVLGSFKRIKESFAKIGDWFTGLSTFGPIDWLKMKDKEKSSYLSQRKVARDSNIDMGKITDALNDQKKHEDLSRQEKKVFAQMRAQGGDGNAEDVQENLAKNKSKQNIVMRTIKSVGDGSTKRSRNKGKK